MIAYMPVLAFIFGFFLGCIYKEDKHGFDK